MVLAAVGMAAEWVWMCGWPLRSAAGSVVGGGLVVATLCAAAGRFGWGLAALAAAALVMTGLVMTVLARRPGGPLPAFGGRGAVPVPVPVPPGERQGQRQEQRQGRFPRALPFGLPYLGLAALALLWLRADPVAGRANLLFLLLLIWASDIGAYVAGRLIGGPKLAPSISPGKTWSGAAGGLLAAVVVGLLCAFVLQTPVAPLRVACLSGALGIIAQAGDLLESRLKRHFGVKDSGHLIPGHGGLLDRLDAVLAAAPVAAGLALAAGPGVVLWQ